MKKIVYAIRDMKMESFGVPVTGDKDAVMIRQFGDVITTGNDGIMSVHPEDFCLYRLGSFDSETGVFENEATPALLARGSDFAVKKD